MRPRAVGLLYESFRDLDIALSGLEAAELTARRAGTSSFAWTAGHVTQMLDSWIVHHFLGLPRAPILAGPEFGAGGTGDVADWPALSVEIATVREKAGSFLGSLGGSDLARSVPYRGSIPALQGRELTLEYALLRIAAHHFTHAGEIAALRGLDGKPLPDNREWGNLFL